MTYGLGEADECDCARCRDVADPVVRDAMAWTEGHVFRPAGHEARFRNVADVRDGLRATEEMLKTLRSI